MVFKNTVLMLTDFPYSYVRSIASSNGNTVIGYTDNISKAVCLSKKEAKNFSSNRYYLIATQKKDAKRCIYHN